MSKRIKQVLLSIVILPWLLLSSCGVSEPTKENVLKSLELVDLHEYSVNEVYSEVSKLQVSAIYEDGTKINLHSSEYSLILKNSDSKVVDVTSKLALGTYSAFVTYKTVSNSYSFNVETAPIVLTKLAVSAVTVKETLTANVKVTYTPSNTTQKQITYSIADETIASVDSNGVVTGLKIGKTTLKVVSVKNPSITATANVTVQENAITLTKIAIPSTINMEVEQTTTVSVTYTPSDATFKEVTWSIDDSSIATIDQTGMVNALKIGTTYIHVQSNRYSTVNAKATLVVKAKTIPVESVSLSSDSVTIDKRSSTTLTATVLPTNATVKTVTWKSSNTNVATVSNGVVTGVTAGTAVITATSTSNTAKYAQCTVTVNNTVGKGAWTVLVYMCGADLESDGGLATGDLKEILSVGSQPADVNIVVQTGGASSWDSTYGISASYNQRWHVANKKLVCDNSKVYSSYASMGLTSTLKDFIVWGMDEYPAEKTGLIFWNHGGALDGVCFDEKKSNDGLTAHEVNSALNSALGSTNKLEFIGYDACLMQVQDIAEFNSHYANYMVGSVESESGYGWDYDTWVDDLYAKKDTTVILKAIVDGFIKENGGTSSSSNDQTLSILDLTKMSAYKDAFESLASSLSDNITSSSAWNTFKTVLNSATKYGYTKNYSSYNNGYVFDVFDVGSFIAKMKANSTYSSTYSSELSSLNTAFNNLVFYSSVGGYYKNRSLTSSGLTLFCPICGLNKGSYSSSSYTNFSTWRTFTYKFGA